MKKLNIRKDSNVSKFTQVNGRGRIKPKILSSGSYILFIICSWPPPIFYSPLDYLEHAIASVESGCSIVFNE